MTMQISHLRLDELIFNSWNSNVVSPENEIKLEESIKRLGMFKPIIVRTLENGSYEVIGGQHRAEVARKLGFEKIPTVILGKIDDNKAKEISLIDNGRFGEDDTLKLSEILGELDTSIEELSSFMPYSLVELNNIFSSSSVALDTLDDVELPFEDELPVLPTASTKTHSIMRFKVPIDDVDKISSLIEHTAKLNGFTESDQLTNAGDALVHLLLGAKS